MSWFERAACRGMPASIFYPEVGENATRAKEICGSCPVAAECLSFALEAGEEFGTWGGLAPRDRGVNGVARLGTRGNPECGSEAGYRQHRRNGEDACAACLAANAAAVDRRRSPVVAWESLGPCHACGVAAGEVCVVLADGWKRMGELRKKPHGGRRREAAA